MWQVKVAFAFAFAWCECALTFPAYRTEENRKTMSLPNFKHLPLLIIRVIFVILV